MLYSLLQMKEYTDQEIIKGLKSGESYAVKYLAKKYLPVISYFISKNNGDVENAKDIFQDALFIIIEKIYANDFNLKGALSTYLFAICKNLWLMELDKMKAARNYMIRREPNQIETDFSESSDRVFYSNVFLQCFDTMDKVSRKILTMYWKEISLAEIAEKLGYSYGYVKKKKSESMKELKDKIIKHPNFKELKKNLNIK
jgi:RNA polymerase sigma factor (sigma-70 family)